jgi:hypothetical protein
MWATDRQRRWQAQRGATVAEFALCVVIFFSTMFFVIEAARAIYLWNTLQEVTRRAAYAAAVSDFSNPAVMAGVRQRALLRDSAGTLLLGAPVSDAHLRIDYLSLPRNADNSLTPTPIAAADMPSCPARALINCAANPGGAGCIRLVRVRICAPGTGQCGTVPYQPLFPLTGIRFALPSSTTMAKAESLGFQPGSTLCP